MAQVVEKTAKTISQALSEALEELGVSEEQVDYEVLEYPSKGLFGILGAKPARIRVKVKGSGYRKPDIVEPESPEEATSSQHAENIDIPEEKKEEQEEVQPERKVVLNPESLACAEKFLGDIFSAMHMEVRISSEITEEGYLLELEGEGLGILIGKRGQTLDALQYLTNLAANRGKEERIRIVIDVENYRRRRENTLRSLAKRLADKAIRMHQEVRLEPMNRHERKIIHMTLQENRRVTTYSDGEEPYRYVVIVPTRQKHGGYRQEKQKTE